MSIDFEKCFDRIEYSAILGSPNYFGFGSVFIKWVDILIHNFLLATQNNGKISEWFSPSRATKQGDPLSSFLYLCCGEVLAHLIENNLNIRGIEICDFIALLSQFADDTMLYLSFDPITLNNIIDTLKIVENNTGLKVYYDKTYIELAHPSFLMQNYTPMNNFFWAPPSETINVLGVTISN